jgi:hypothetical protein
MLTFEAKGKAFDAILPARRRPPHDAAGQGGGRLYAY